jgi:hypothetical protein
VKNHVTITDTFALLAPMDQVKRSTDLSIPPFLRRPKPSKNWRPPVVEHTRHVPQALPRPDNLTASDKEVIAQLLNGHATFKEAKKSLSLARLLASQPERVPSQRKAKRSQLVDMKVIAQRLDIEPKQARQALRDLGLKKGPSGWVFHPSEVDLIIEQIRPLLKPKA